MGCVNAKAADDHDRLDATTPSALPDKIRQNGYDAKSGTGVVEAEARTPVSPAVTPTPVVPIPEKPVAGQPVIEKEAPPPASPPRKVEPPPPPPELRLLRGLEELPYTDEVSGVDGPEYVQIVDIPAGGYRLRYSCLSKRGYYPEAPGKSNQDSFYVGPNFGGEANDHLFGVYDGHGEHGTPCSQFACARVADNLLRHRLFRTDVPQAFHGAFVSANAQLHRAPIDDTMSGTTGIGVFLRGRTLYAANVGDSRAVLAERRGKKVVAVDLSNDQTPFREDECARVRACGARVLTLDQLEGLKNPHVQCWGGEDDDDGDPPRLWVPNGMYPGTAFTRSLGDTVAERIGVTAVPEVLVLPLTEHHPFFIIASDGVFEFLSSQAVVDMVVKFDSPYDACAAVVAESYRLWLQYETRTDDITIIVIMMEGLSGPAPYPAMSPGTPAALPAGPVRNRRKAIEGVGQEVDATWMPRFDGTVKSAQELMRLEGALRGNFLFQQLTEQQRQLLIESMGKLYVQAGDVVIRQGEIGDKFYCCEDGEFEVLVAQEQGDGGETASLGTVVHRYSSASRPCFGDLALLYATRREASVRAATSGSLWVLERKVYRAVQRNGLPPTPLVRILRSVALLRQLTFTQLQRLASMLQPQVLHDGDLLITSEEELEKAFILESGQVEMEVLDTNGFVHSGPWDESDKKKGLERHGPGDVIGDWLLTPQGQGPRITVIARGEVRLVGVTLEQISMAVGSLAAVAAVNDRLRQVQSQLSSEREKDPKRRQLGDVQLSQLEWEEGVMEHDCFEIGHVRHRHYGVGGVLKRWSKAKVHKLGRSLHTLRERALLKSLNPSPFVPDLVTTVSSSSHVGLLFQARLGAPLSLLLQEPLAEGAARFIAASIVLALQLLHQDGVVCRSVAPDTLYVDEKGRLQLADLRYAKRLTDGRTLTMCGSPDFLAPEIVLGNGHGQQADWWALGVLVYMMLVGEGPFGSWRDSELQVYTRIAQRQLHLPRTLPREASDLVEKLLVARPEDRLGCGKGGVGAVKEHPWFAGIKWDDLMAHSLTPHPQILQRLAAAQKLLPAVEHSVPAKAPGRQPHNQDSPWFEGW